MLYRGFAGQNKFVYSCANIVDNQNWFVPKKERLSK
jgi:hypothetical protein